MKWTDVDYYYLCLKDLKCWEEILGEQITDKSSSRYDRILYGLQDVIHSLEIKLTLMGVDLKGGD